MADKYAARKAGRFQPGRTQKRERFDKKKIFPKQRRRGDIVDEEINSLKEKYDSIDSNQLNSFKDFPLSHKSQKGLQNANYYKPTDIQREAILLALRGNDILGAAKTGSGKTLAFLIPALECLYRAKWSQEDGLGVLVITPTRELAYQIYEVLRKIGRFHDFSAGLVIGGKHLREEAERIQRTNIVICTPGRLQQHLDETPYFSADGLQMLVLDEADRILDLGFQQSMNAIIENLPVERQTLLFSATQTKSVKDLARLSLQEPMYVSVHEMAQHSTPSQLRQNYIVCEQHEKLDMLWSFIKNHLKSKTLVFLTSCKQVRFVFEAFRRMRPGVTVLSLHGAMQQLKRVEVYNSFCRKKHAVLFATDIAARGLDFPSVNWVVQLDCPEDANTYIHRAGRTARYETDGEALLILLPSEEEAMMKQLEEKKIPINKIKVNVKRMSSIKRKLESLCAAEVALKEFAQRCFVSYMKAIYLMKNKEVFDVTKIDSDEFAASLGLAIPPRVRFIQRKMQKFSNKEVLTKEYDNVFGNAKGTLSGPKSNVQQTEGESRESESEESAEDSEEEETKLNTLKKSGEKFDFDVGEEGIDDILTVKTKEAVKIFDSDDDKDDSNQSEDDATNLFEKEESKKKKKGVMTKAKLAKKLQRKNIKVNTKVTFDDEGEEVLDRIHKTQFELEERKEQMDEEEEGEDEEPGGLDLELAKKRMEEEDKIDKELYRERIKRRHREKRLKEKEARRQESGQTKAEDENDLEELDMSLFPDPDKLYGKTDDNDEDDDDSPPAKRLRSEESDEEESGDEEESDEESDEESEGGSGDEETTEGGPGVSLEDDEALALRLLG